MKKPRPVRIGYCRGNRALPGCRSTAPLRLYRVTLGGTVHVDLCAKCIAKLQEKLEENLDGQR